MVFRIVIKSTRNSYPINCLSNLPKPAQISDHGLWSHEGWQWHKASRGLIVRTELDLINFQQQCILKKEMSVLFKRCFIFKIKICFFLSVSFSKYVSFLSVSFSKDVSFSKYVSFSKGISFSQGVFFSKCFLKRAHRRILSKEL